MERSPQGNESDEQVRPRLDIDLQGPEGNVFILFIRAREQLEGDALKSFNKEIWDVTQIGSGKKYDDILAIVNSYMELTDTSGLYPAYTIEGKVTAAVGRLQEQVATLPPSVNAGVEGLWPDFDSPDTGSFAYMAVLDDEITRVQDEIVNGDESQREAYQQYLAMLQECTATFRRTGL
jgi:hypothetical protein